MYSFNNLKNKDMENGNFLYRGPISSSPVNDKIVLSCNKNAKTINDTNSIFNNYLVRPTPSTSMLEEYVIESTFSKILVPSSTVPHVHDLTYGSFNMLSSNKGLIFSEVDDIELSYKENSSEGTRKENKMSCNLVLYDRDLFSISPKHTTEIERCTLLCSKSSNIEIIKVSRSLANVLSVLNGKGRGGEDYCEFYESTG